MWRKMQYVVESGARLTSGPTTLSRFSIIHLMQPTSMPLIHRNAKSGYQTSHPPILLYLAEGTTFDNLLVCDPLSSGNRSAYSKILVKLQMDGDTENSAKLKKILTSD